MCARLTVDFFLFMCQKCKKMLKAVFGKIYSDKIHCERFGSKGTLILKMVKYEYKVWTIQINEVGVNLLNQFACKD